MGVCRGEGEARQIDVRTVATSGCAVVTDAMVTDAVVTDATVTDMDRDGLAQLHESLGALLASRGQWREAYGHLRVALDLSHDPAADIPVPVALSSSGQSSSGLSSSEAQSPEVLRLELSRLRREHAVAREQSLRDSLTASYNRRYLDQRLDDLLTMTAPGTDLALALIDLDFFKQVNDTHGHHLGDRVLQRVVEVLQDGLPDGAFCARYGGEEFVLVLPGVGAAAAVTVCESARARIERQPWTQLVAGLRVTVSIGVAHHNVARPSDPATADRLSKGVPELLESADQLLYQAKQAGRNAVAFRGTNGVALAGMAAHRRRRPGE